MSMRVVFLDRASLKTSVRTLSFEADYLEYVNTVGDDEVVERLYGADIAVTNKDRCAPKRCAACRV